MADSHPTPESKPMKSTATVTPTLHLSEGPLTPLGKIFIFLFFCHLKILFVTKPWNQAVLSQYME